MSKNGDGEFGAHNQIAKGTRIQGDIKTEGVLRIDGTLIGSVESTGKLVVGPSGKIEGSIRCNSANISGEVKAKIIVKELLTLQASAKLQGEITTGKLAIEPGATFSGSCSMGGVIKDIALKETDTLAEKTA
ncbi:MAG: polymer-forming cytoskeletal protein [Flavobacteriales bacterium]|nr:polymer-forming cytoskeletal protein [Flavobacteriales bacterium]